MEFEHVMYILLKKEIIVAPQHTEFINKGSLCILLTDYWSSERFVLMAFLDFWGSRSSEFAPVPPSGECNGPVS